MPLLTFAYLPPSRRASTHVDPIASALSLPLYYSISASRFPELLPFLYAATVCLEHVEVTSSNMAVMRAC